MDYMKMIELSGMNPTMMQNNQSAQTQQAMQYGNQLANQALTGNGFSPQQMANALRQGQAQQPQNTSLTFDQQLEVMRLGSNPYSAKSDYMTGANGWGNYGE
jgi:predicted GNAT family N-acyltransferase